MAGEYISDIKLGEVAGPLRQLTNPYTFFMIQGKIAELLKRMKKMKPEEINKLAKEVLEKNETLIGLISKELRKTRSELEKGKRIYADMKEQTLTQAKVKLDNDLLKMSEMENNLVELKKTLPADDPRIKQADFDREAAMKQLIADEARIKQMEVDFAADKGIVDEIPALRDMKAELAELENAIGLNERNLERSLEVRATVEPLAKDTAPFKLCEQFRGDLEKNPQLFEDWLQEFEKISQHTQELMGGRSGNEISKMYAAINYTKDSLAPDSIEKSLGMSKAELEKMYGKESLEKLGYRNIDEMYEDLQDIDKALKGMDLTIEKDINGNVASFDLKNGVIKSPDISENDQGSLGNFTGTEAELKEKLNIQAEKVKGMREDLSRRMFMPQSEMQRGHVQNMLTLSKKLNVEAQTLTEMTKKLAVIDKSYAPKGSNFPEILMKIASTVTEKTTEINREGRG